MIRLRLDGDQIEIRSQLDLDQIEIRWKSDQYQPHYAHESLQLPQIPVHEKQKPIFLWNSQKSKSFFNF